MASAAFAGMTKGAKTGGGTHELVAFLRKTKTKIKSAIKDGSEEIVSGAKATVEKHGATAGKVALGAAGGAAALAAASGEDGEPKKKRPYLKGES